tara:strand:+ start:834 stop:1037 length:204 start_codon:yes stop_codon:yes gene_type:complete
MSQKKKKPAQEEDMEESDRSHQKENHKINKDIDKSSSTGRLSAKPNVTPTRHTIADPSQLSAGDSIK